MGAMLLFDTSRRASRPRGAPTKCAGVSVPMGAHHASTRARSTPAGQQAPRHSHSVDQENGRAGRGSEQDSTACAIAVLCGVTMTGPPPERGPSYREHEPAQSLPAQGGYDATSAQHHAQAGHGLDVYVDDVRNRCGSGPSRRCVEGEHAKRRSPGGAGASGPASDRRGSGWQAAARTDRTRGERFRAAWGRRAIAGCLSRTWADSRNSAWESVGSGRFETSGGCR